MVVAVTGAASGVGRLLVQRLLTREGSRRIAEVVAIDSRRGEADGAVWHVADVCDPRLAVLLAGVDVLVHTADDRSLETPPRQRRAHNIRATQTVLTAAAAQRVPRVVLVTSTMVYGAAPDNDVPLDETLPFQSEPESSLVGDFVEIEELAALARRAHPGLSVTVLRPAPLVGPGMDTLLSRHFSAPRLLTVKGSAPKWQFCHVDDLASALDFVIRTETEGKGGALAVGCDGFLEHEQVEEIAQLRSFELPADLAFGTTQRLHRVGITPAPASELKFLVYPCVVDCAALRTAGWRPAHDNVEVLRALLDHRSGRPALVGRNLGRKEVTITAAGAAGAAVAAIGTAVAAHHLRKRRKS
ncbi:NAD-dependent epimerase/dehydratase family protein [Thermobifida halotolerans]|uniref:NAD-dependent epimerase/dehydratase family protein n=1 Tax=Thermobifida halotolerans TaxID=483545 RepID=A0A399FZX5_9ACTN|nr:NAD-dependent epimerase/dehydratase family protein [Thermobifida halotolerans]